MTTLQFPSRQAGDTNNWHTPLQADLAALNTDLTDIRGDSVPSNGVTDAGPEIQRLYDAGISWRGKSTGTYLISTPVFFDKADVYGRYSMDFNGAKIILGPGLPTTPQFFRDSDPATACQWAFFANTKRTALSGGVVTVSTANRASGSTGQLMPVIIRNCTVNGQSSNRGLMFGNRSGARFESVTLLNGRTLYSWDDYSDVASFIDCHNRGNVITDSALLTQINPGDGVVIDGCKADAGMYIGHMSNCHGASIRGSVTGRFAFVDCSAIKFDGAHQENISNTYNIKSVDSHITFDRSVLYPARSATVPILEIADNTGFSNIAFRDCNVHRLNASGATADDPWGPWLSFTTVTDGTKVVFDNSFATDVSTAATSDGYLPGAFGRIAATGTALTAMASAFTIAAQAKIGTGSFSIQKINGAWAVRNMDGSSGGVIGAIANPVMTTTLGKLTGGTMVNGTTYSYVCAIFDALGRSTGRSALVTAVQTTAGTVRLKITGAPGTVRIWRKATATGADTAPTHYVDVEMSGGVMYVFDSGANCAGEPWLTTSIPASTTTNSCTATAYADGAGM